MYERILNISRTSKGILVLVFDTIAILIAVTLALILRVSDPWPAASIAYAFPFYAIILLLGLALSFIFGTPRTKHSSFDLQAVAKVGLLALTLSIIGTALNLVMPLGAPRTVPMIFGPLMFCLAVGWRITAFTVLNWLRNSGTPRMPVAVYGAGSAGIQLISALNQSSEFRVVALVDDNPSLRGVTIGGLRVKAPAALEGLAHAGRIERILIAIPSLSKARQRTILERLEDLPCDVHSLPTYVEIVKNGELVQSLKEISIDDLLGRDKVDLDVPEIARAYRHKVVLISGAGGSIGGELCRQVLSCGPRRIVLFEHSEFALYSIDRELGPVAARAGVEVVPVLGSVTNRPRVERTLALHEVDIVLHAAAYKHVPMIEENELEGVRNNIFGTRVIAEAAAELGVERFILVSTDKAVRPTNVMGSTKRLAEMVIQDLQRRSPATRFAMVRFGNVLGSSGSVIPLFQSQIHAGGPITLTHPEVTRFFMTMPEAARLVLLAGSFAAGGDLFVLDMGRPVKILDLARRMIDLSGLSVRDETNPNGDIAIEITGLRPGEKLYEELLIDDDRLLPTPHPKILCAEEDCPSELEIAGLLRELANALELNSPATVRRQLETWVEGYRSAERPARVAAQ